MERRDKRNYYLDLAEMVSKRSTCLRRAYGAVIVKNDEVISTGYVGAPRGRKNCSDMGYCIRAELQIPRDKMIDSTMYLTGLEPDGGYVSNSCCCSMCKRMVINAGIKEVVIRDDKNNYRVIPVETWIENDESLEGKKGY